MLEFLKGKRTYIVAAITVVVTGLKGTGYIDDAAFAVIMGLLGAAGLTTLRAAQSK